MRGIFGALAAERKDTSNTTYGPVDLWRDLFGGRVTNSGVTVTWQKALEVTTVLRCAAVIAEDLCSVPWKLYQKDGTRRIEARDHPAWDIIHSQPNDWQSSFEFRETIGLHLALCQNAYVFKNVVRGRIAELIPFEPGHVSVERRDDLSLWYTVRGVNGQTQIFPQEAIWHIRGRSWNGWLGLETIQLAREAIGLAIAHEQSQATLQKSGVQPSGVLSREGTMEPEQFRQLRKWIDLHYAGAEHAGKAMILDGNSKWTSLRMTNVEAEGVESRNQQVEEICRAFGIMPLMVGFSDKASTYASAEQMFIQHYTRSARVWYRRIEGSADLNLLSESERRAGFYTGFVDQELLRGDHKSRAQYYKTALGGGSNPGWMTGNEVRRAEEMDDTPGLDRPWGPINAAPISEDGKAMIPPKAAPITAPEPEDEEDE